MHEFAIASFKLMITNPIFVGIIVLGIISFFFYPQIVGFFGELHVKSELKKLSQKEYLILHNIMLFDNNSTHQIDYIIISKYGIFIIEAKNYNGLIIGKDNMDNWTQYLGKNKYNFKNPVHQNYGHIITLSNVLNMNKNKFISIVCFSNKATLKLQSNNIVVNNYNLLKTIKMYNDVIIDDDLNKIYNKIVNLNIKDKKQRKEHIKNIKEKINDNNNKIDNMICPKCGNQLVIRKGKNGNFIGCSNYPNCRFTKNL